LLALALALPALPVALPAACFGPGSGFDSDSDSDSGFRSGKGQGQGARGPRGRPKIFDGPPRTFAKSQTDPPTHQPTFFFLAFFLVLVRFRFRAFLGKGSSKTPLKYFCKKSMSKTFPKKIDKIFDVSFS
jgi:hypothetical protein